jgi:ligand-binding SRPBCC domain-containing protein
MAYYQLLSTQQFPVSIPEMWNFIAAPQNLKEITPEYMNFVITSNSSEDTMYPGMIITYKVTPLRGLRLNWMTEITHVKEYEFFVDEQRIGPYSLWHHQHKLAPIEGGVEMTDIVTYAPPLGMLGAALNTLFIKQQLRKIFDYRALALEKRFGKYPKAI